LIRIQIVAQFDLLNGLDSALLLVYGLTHLIIPSNSSSDRSKNEFSCCTENCNARRVEALEYECSPAQLVEKMANLTEARRDSLVDGSVEEDEQLKTGNGRRTEHSSSSTKSSGRVVITRVLTHRMCARVEDRTFICSLSKDAAGPTNNWEEPFAMRRRLKELFDGSMAWTHDVCAAVQHGSVGSPMSQIGVQLTDSPYVVVNMRIMARIGMPIYAEIDKDYKRVVPCMHSVGAPLATVSRMCRGRATKKSTSCTFLRRARFGHSDRLRRQRSARQEMFRAAYRFEHRARRGWMAEHMLIVGVENPQGEKTYVTAAFSQRLWQDEFRDADSAHRFEGWKVYTVGDRPSPGIKTRR
jgi:phosphoenolpyruvate carboxykinase (GTP)